MEWEHCIRCGSNRVGLRGGIGCLGMVVIIIVSTIITTIITRLLHLGIFSTPLTVVLAIVGYTYINKKSKYLYCKDCEGRWKRKR